MTLATINALLIAAGTVGEQVRRGLLPGEAFRNRAIEWVTEEGLAFFVNVAASIVILVVGKFVIRLFASFVSRSLDRTNVKHLIKVFVRNVITKCCWALLVVLVLARMGVHIGPLLAGLGVTGFVLGFAFQESLGNFAAGLMIALNEPYKIGDYVSVSGHEGVVRKMDMMAATLVSSDNKKVIIPNKSAWGSPIVNYTALGHRRVDLKVGVAYGMDVARAIKVALETLPTVPGVVAEPAPSVNVASLDDSQVTLNLWPWANCSDFCQVRSDVQVAIKAAFDRNGIDIPFPQITVHTASKEGQRVEDRGEV